MREFQVYLYGVQCGPLPSSFEAAADRLQRLDRLYFEPDGSFVWSIGTQEQVFGMLYDTNGQLQYAELRGSCCHPTWRELVRAIAGDSEVPFVVMQLPDRRLQELQSFERSCWHAQNS